MTTSTNENERTAQATAAAEKPEASKKSHVAPRKPHVAASKAKSANKTTSAKKGAKGPKAGNKVTGAREGSKTAQVLNMLNQSGGATLKELMKATGWQRHSVRGFLSGTLGKKMKLTVTSTKVEGGERTYSVKA